MNYTRFLQKILFKFRVESNWHSSCAQFMWTLRGARIGKGTTLSQIELNWPHQLQIGQNCRLEPRIAFKFDGGWSDGPRIKIRNRVFLGRNCEFNICEGIAIGDDCLIASGCRFIDHNHGISLDSPMNTQPGINAAIIIEEDVWIGVNAVVLKGVHIGRGAIVGAGAVVTKSVGAHEIWAGVPARRIGLRM